MRRIRESGYFLAGLRSDVRCKIRPHKPRDLSSAMELAGDFEEAGKAENRYSNPHGCRFKFHPKSDTVARNFGGNTLNPAQGAPF